MWWFDRVDADQDGSITSSGIRSLPEEQQGALYEVIHSNDADGDGELSKADLLSALNSGKVTLDTLLAISPEPQP